jgi:hypothetical protein
VNTTSDSPRHFSFLDFLLQILAFIWRGVFS